MKNTNGTNKRRNLLLANEPRIAFWRTERCCKGSRGTGEVLYIDQHIHNGSMLRRKNLAMAWIDNKNTHVTVPQKWIINCLKMYKISDEVRKFIERTMKTLRVELTPGWRCLAEAKIHSGICPGDALSALPFVIAMMPLNYIHRKFTARYKLSKSQKKYQSPNVHGIYQTVCQK